MHDTSYFLALQSYRTLGAAYCLGIWTPRRWSPRRSESVMDGDRERLLSQTLVELADTLVTGFDVVEFTHLLTERCVEILGGAPSGISVAE